MVSTLRGFTRWLYRTANLGADPSTETCSGSRPGGSGAPRHSTAEDLERILSAAKEVRIGRQRMLWPTRDVALVRFLATTGARAEETCAVTIGELDRRAERPIWRVGKSKGDKARDVPLPKTTVDALDECSRRVRRGTRWPLARRRAHRFVEESTALALAGCLR
jgi:integrase